ncbi:hypothetical protein KIPB_015447, partial [Kipferlia bialata]
KALTLECAYCGECVVRYSQAQRGFHLLGFKMRTRKGQKYPCATHKPGCREYPPDPAMHLSVQDHTHIP